MKSGIKKAKCKTCNSYLLSWGKTSSGKKRYYCKICKNTRIYRKKVDESGMFSLFKQYVLFGLTYEMLSTFSGYSIRHLEETFHRFLNQIPPSLSLPSPTNPSFLLVDGLWFGRFFVLLVYRQSRELTILHISVAGREASTKIEKDLKFILARV